MPPQILADQKAPPAAAARRITTCPPRFLDFGPCLLCKLMLLLIIYSFSYPTSILGLQDLKPLNIVLLEPDTNNLTSILDQDKYTCYQDSLEDQNYVPGIEEIALILSTKVKNFCFSQTPQCSKWYEISDMEIFQTTAENPDQPRGLF